MAIEIEEQHPIPQDIASYQFRLVGDMTLKQFLQVAAGVVFAMLLYASKLHPFIKWPLILLSFFGGLALAFVPIEDRPLAMWIAAFFRSIYSPTIFIYKKTVSPDSFFAPEGSLPPTEIEPEKLEQVVPEDKVTGNVFVSEEEAKAMVSLEKQEQSFLSKITHLFSLPSLAPAKAVQQSTPSNLNIPEPITISIDPNKQKQNTPSQKDDPSTQDQDTSLFTETVSPTLHQQSQQTTPTTFSDQAAPPIPPSKPNLIVGQVIDHQGDIIEGAILEVRDEDGRPVRALKSNKLGHFMIVTPLFEGKYQLTTEKEGFDFEPYSFEAKGQLIPPIAITAKPANQTNNQKLSTDTNKNENTI